MNQKTKKKRNHKPTRYLLEGQTQDFSLYARTCVKRMKELICVDSPIMNYSFCLGKTYKNLEIFF